MFNLTNKINARNSLFALSITALGFLIAPNSAQAMTLVNNANFDDDDFKSLINQKEFTELFVAEGRIGDRGGAGEKELKINGDVVDGAKVSTEEQFNWGNGSVYDFSLMYDGNKVTYELDGKTLSSEDFNGSANSIFLRTFAKENKGNNSNNFVTLKDLVFNGESIGSLSSLGGESKDVDYLQLKDISSPFTLTGKTSMSWTGNNPMRSNLAFQIKVGNSPTPTSVPEPGTIGAIFVTGMTGLGLSKKNKKDEEI
ncbi:choice-of-anchor W domain-containing protein [Calothrix sp. CCY 0018]|uniref:choice-of-anchor W domain-containing protein n=1 Tax=Calothrix sp. CCY 0018 TaxID=3103864 RepID=UPI0039C68EA6